MQLDRFASFPVHSNPGLSWSQSQTEGSHLPSVVLQDRPPKNTAHVGADAMAAETIHNQKLVFRPNSPSMFTHIWSPGMAH
jgi:hypothetical protein